MKKVVLIIILFGLILFANKSYCAEKDSLKLELSFGAMGGLAQNNFYEGDLFFGLIIPIKRMNLEADFGYSVFGNKTSYRGIDNLKFRSHGLFMTYDLYLIRGLYAGIKLAINFNWINENSQKLFDNYQNIKSPTFFTGKAIYGQTGYYFPIGNAIGIKLQAQAGLHNYKISEGWLLIDNTDNYLRNERIELHAEFLYNLSVGLIVKL